MDRVLGELGVFERVRLVAGSFEGAEMVVEGSEAVHADEVRRRWEELPRWQQAGIVAVSAVEIVLTTAAVIDLVRRPRDRVRGPKTLWALGLTIQPFGPIAYLALARRR